MRASSLLARTLLPAVLALAVLVPVPGLTQIAVRDIPTIEAIRIETPPVVDGVLDDAIWRGEPQIARLTMTFPHEGRAPSQHTEVWVRVDREALYVAFRCYDDPAAIRATVMTQDANMLSDDRVNLLIDPFHDERNAYFFQINPLGTRGESLSGPDFENFRPEWDTIWYGDAQVDEQGWTAEIVIPFHSLPFNPESDTWGFEVERNMPRLGERDRWANWSRNKMVTNPQNIGAVRGLRGSDGRGIDVKPVFSTTYERDRIEDDRHRIGRPGLDVFFRPTSSITTALTLNTDFADAPVDDRQVNLGRFATFFPETRDFFLQDAGTFDFAGLSENGRPFFSRRIGLVDGQVINLDGGLKATGRVGDVEFGALQVRMASERGLGAADLGAARVKLNVLESSQVGVILTHGDPLDEIDNTVVGTDFRYRNARFRGDKLLNGNLWLQRSQSSGVHGREAAFGAEIEYPNDIVNYSLGFTEIQENFDPRLGFVNRRGFRQYKGSLRYRIRPDGWIQRIDFAGDVDTFTNRDDELETSTLRLTVIEIANNPEDKVRVEYFNKQDRPVLGFFPAPDAFVPAGRYHYDAWQLKLETSTSRPVMTRLEYGWGSFYEGRLMRAKATIELRPSRHFFASLFWDESRGSLPAQVVNVDGVPVRFPGDFTVRLLRALVNVNFSPKMSWTNTIQYDNVSDSIGLNSRFRWEVEPGNELFFIINQGWENERSSITGTISQVTAKVAWTFRF